MFRIDTEYQRRRSWSKVPKERRNSMGRRWNRSIVHVGSLRLAHCSRHPLPSTPLAETLKWSLIKRPFECGLIVRKTGVRFCWDLCPSWVNILGKCDTVLWGSSMVNPLTLMWLLPSFSFFFILEKWFGFGHCQASFVLLRCWRWAALWIGD